MQSWIDYVDRRFVFVKLVLRFVEYGVAGFGSSFLRGAFPRKFAENPERERWVQERAKALARWSAQVGSSATTDPDYEEEQRHVSEVIEALAMSTEAVASVAMNPLTPDQSRIAVTLLVSDHSLLDSIEASRRI